jgi:hypothetical protein
MDKGHVWFGCAAHVFRGIEVGEGFVPLKKKSGRARLHYLCRFSDGNEKKAVYLQFWHVYMIF